MHLITYSYDVFIYVFTNKYVMSIFIYHYQQNRQKFILPPPMENSWARHRTQRYFKHYVLSYEDPGNSLQQLVEPDTRQETKLQ